MAEITIIIPVYNTEKYLRKCLDSVLNQSFQDFELLCIDDHSVDSSAEILREYAKKDSRIRLFFNESNKGQALARNVGLEHAGGNYVCFVDSDDYIDPNFLADLYKMAEKTGAEVVMNYHLLCESNAGVSEYHHPSMPEIPASGCFFTKESAIVNCCFGLCLSLYKRTLFDNNKLRFEPLLMEDLLFLTLVFFYADSAFVFKAPSAYHYLTWEGSVSVSLISRKEQSLNAIKAYDRIYEHLSSRGLVDAFPSKLFSAWGYFLTDTEEAYRTYKAYFIKIERELAAHKERYNEMELFFAESILLTADFADYQSKYPASLAVAYLKRKKMRK